MKFSKFLFLFYHNFQMIKKLVKVKLEDLRMKNAKFYIKFLKFHFAKLKSYFIILN